MPGSENVKSTLAPRALFEVKFWTPKLSWNWTKTEHQARGGKVDLKKSSSYDVPLQKMRLVIILWSSPSGPLSIFRISEIQPRQNPVVAVRDRTMKNVGSMIDLRRERDFRVCSRTQFFSRSIFRKFSKLLFLYRISFDSTTTTRHRRNRLPVSWCQNQRKSYTKICASKIFGKPS